MYDVIVIGAGPSGMMASIVASSNKRVLLIEKNDIVGKKLELTGGGRCNLTNLKSVDNFIKEIPVNNKVLYSCLNKFGPQDIYDYFNELGILLKVENDDRVFPVSNKSKTIIDALYNQLIINNVDIHLNEIVQKIDIKDNCKQVITNKGIYESKNIVIATGGCSYPITGSTGDGYKFAKKMNQRVTDLYPAETFLICKEILPLAGITLDNVIVSINKKQGAGSMLFTHQGLSGPSIFKISEEVYKELHNKEYVTISIDFIPDYKLEELEKELNNNINDNVKNFIKKFLPKRLTDYIIDMFNYNKTINNISLMNRLELIKILKDFKIDIKSTGSIEQSFVTGGGIDIKYINTKTMKSTLNKGIYFVGEILDVHGHTGGYNITIALSTGYAAGKDIYECIN